MTLRYLPDFLSEPDHDHLLAWLLEDAHVSWHRESFNIFGRRVPAPRQLAWFGDAGINYRYTGNDHVAEGWPPALACLRQQIICEAGSEFNFVLMNRYDDGRDHMGWHRDDERSATPLIASLSMGGIRRFRYADEGGARHAIDLQPGSLLLFDGRLRHQLAKTARPTSVRINLTFRRILAARTHE